MVTQDFLAEMDAAAARYRERTAERERVRRTIAERGVLHADDPARVSKRLARMNVDWALARAVERTAPAATTGRSLGETLSPELYGSDVLGLERLLGRSDLIDVAFLERGYRASRPIGRITLRTDGGGYGTGALVSPRLLLTNNHVLRGAASASAAYLELDYQAGLDGLPLQPVVFGFDPEAFFLTDRGLDFTLVAVQPRGRDGAELASFGHLKLIESEGKVILGEKVNIVQHPNGEPKQLALRENELVDLLDRFLHYATDTAPGSSGSPVFNDQWEVVGLHHRGVPRTDDDGRYLTADGTPWTPEMGDDRLAWVANEGVRISRILAALRAASLSGAAAALRDELLEASVADERTPGDVPAASAARDGAALSGRFAGQLAGGSVAAAGASSAVRAPGEIAAWTLPLRISVGLDGSTPVVASAQSADGAMPLAPAVERELRGAIATLEATRARPYYEAGADATARDAYYDGVDPGASPRKLRESLAELLERTHAVQPAYQPMKHVYPWVDLHPDRKLRSIYSGQAFEPLDLIERDARIESARLELAAAPHEAGVVELEAAQPYNCEHVVPQSSFAKREPMRGDLHHLFACESRCNSFRGNTPYFDFPDFEETVRDACGRREDSRFEPSAGKGAAARATLYFLLRYPDEVGDAGHELQADRLPILLAWHAAHPVDEWERHRNAAIAEIQGNRNPLIDHPEWAERIDFAAAFG